MMFITHLLWNTLSYFVPFFEQSHFLIYNILNSYQNIYQKGLIKKFIGMPLRSAAKIICIFSLIIVGATDSIAQTSSLSSSQQKSPQEQALLSQLHDIVLPEKIGVWPLSATVWIILSLIVIAVITLLFFWLKKRKTNLYRKTANKELSIIIKSYQKNIAKTDKITLQQNTTRKILQILKQTYFTAYPYKRDTVAGIYGTAFIVQLRDTLNNNHKLQSWSKVHINSEVIYSAPENIYESTTSTEDDPKSQQLERTLSQLEVFAKNWIKYHLNTHQLNKHNTKIKGNQNV